MRARSVSSAASTMTTRPASIEARAVAQPLGLLHEVSTSTIVTLVGAYARSGPRCRAGPAGRDRCRRARRGSPPGGCRPAPARSRAAVSGRRTALGVPGLRLVSQAEAVQQRASRRAGGRRSCRAPGPRRPGAAREVSACNWTPSRRPRSARSWRGSSPSTLISPRSGVRRPSRDALHGRRLAGRSGRGCRRSHLLDSE